MWWRRSRGEREIREEIESHLAMAERDLRERGTPADRARADARRQFGNTVQVLDAVRDVRGRSWVGDIGQDLRGAIRSWRRSPGIAAVGVATLGIAIGLGASLFTAVDTLFLARWPVRDPSRLAQFRTVGGSAAEVERLSARTRTFSGLAAIACMSCHARVMDRDLRIHAVTDNFFDVLGVPMALGHGFAAAGSGATFQQRAAVLSHSFWRTVLNADPNVVGTWIRVNDETVQVLGVVAREFTGTTIDNAPALWIPLATAPSLGVPPEALGIQRMIGRLIDGVSRQTAQAEMNVLLNAVGERVGARHAVTLREATYVPLSKLEEAGALGLMSVAVLLVLLLACANVGNLILARAAAQARETATRLALGASRSRLVRQFLAESLVLAAAACAVGVALAFVVPGLVMNAVGAASPRPLDLAVPFVPGARAVLFAAGLAALSVVAFGLAPALLASRQDAAATLKSAGLALTARLGPRRVLLAVQVAVSTVLLVSAGLIAQSVRAAGRLDLGFDVTGVAQGALQLPASLPVAARTRVAQAFFREAQLVDSDAVAVWGQQLGYAAGVHVSRIDAPDDAPIRAVRFDVTPSIFAVLRIPILRGRSVDPSAPEGVVVSETLAGRLWPDTGGVGQSIVAGQEPRHVVGVVADADLLGASLQNEFVTSRPAVYQLLTEASPGARALVRRDRPDLAQALALTASRLHAEAELALTPLADIRDRRLDDSRLAAGLAALVGLAALAMATVGIAGVFGYVARQRRREVGLHIALGARPSDVLRRVFGSSVSALAVGIAVGFAGGAVAASLLRGYVHPDIGHFDPTTYAAVGVILATAGLAAIVVPGRAATRLSPVLALRSE